MSEFFCRTNTQKDRQTDIWGYRSSLPELKNKLIDYVWAIRKCCIVWLRVTPKTGNNLCVFLTWSEQLCWISYQPVPALQTPASALRYSRQTNKKIVGKCAVLLGIYNNGRNQNSNWPSCWFCQKHILPFSKFITRLIALICLLLLLYLSCL